MGREVGSVEPIKTRPPFTIRRTNSEKPTRIKTEFQASNLKHSKKMVAGGKGPVNLLLAFTLFAPWLKILTE